MSTIQTAVRLPMVTNDFVAVYLSHWQNDKISAHDLGRNRREFLISIPRTIVCYLLSCYNQRDDLCPLDDGL